MVKIRIYELSKELNVGSKDIVAFLNNFGIIQKNHMSTLEENELDLIFEHYTKEFPGDVSPFIKKEEEVKKKPKTAAAPKADKPQGEQRPAATKQSRIVDTRPVDIDLDKLDEEKIDKLVPEEFMNAGKQKQKIKKSAPKKKQERVEDKPKAEPQKVQEKITVQIPDEISVGDLAARLNVAATQVIKKLMALGIMASVSQVIDFDTASLISEDLGAVVEKEIIITEEDKLFNDVPDDEKDLITRPPVVVVMGHVDHGKTSLLDAIRNTNVITTEAGGITQHIGAYKVKIHDKDITFLDTPGHEAFTAMRARGAQATDIAILVVAADDGIMPQTIEAINHAKAAEVNIVVAINKIDKEGANPDRVMQELTEHGLVPEDWGGDTICVPVSAKKGENIDTLLEMVILVAEMKELKANPNRKAKGIVIESKLDKSRGPVATVLVQNGTLKTGDIIVAGTAVGRVRAMQNDKGALIKTATPSTPVEICGLSEVPDGGDTFYAVTDERKAREVVEQRKEKIKASKAVNKSNVSLDDLFNQIKEGEIKDLNLVIKADVQGSVEAVKQSLEKLSNDEVRVRMIHGGVGAIRESDIMLASASNAIVVGFNVRPDAGAHASAVQNGVDVRLYRVIYTAIEEIEAAMKGMLAPTYVEKLLGHCEIRTTFKVSSVGTIGGGYVQDGKILRNSEIRLIRDGIVIHEGKLASLKRFKDDVKEVAAGYECGISIENYNDIKEGDVIEAFMMEEVKQ